MIEIQGKFSTDRTAPPPLFFFTSVASLWKEETARVATTATEKELDKKGQKVEEQRAKC